MSVGLTLMIGFIMGSVLSAIWFYFARVRQLEAEFALELSQLQQNHALEIEAAKKRSVNTSRAVLKGKMAEQFAPILPEFHYLPSDARFLGDPVDYVIFSGYSEYREGLLAADDIEIIFMDIKSGQARLSKGQMAIAQAIQEGRFRFETLKIDPIE